MQTQDTLAQIAGQMPPAIPWLTYLLIAFFGAFGGFLYGTRLHALVFPHRKVSARHELHLGFINDLLVGVGGAMVIFLIVPGTFTFDPGDPVNFIRGIATAFLGGYGGYALIDRVLNKKLRELEDKMEENQAQNKEEAKLKEWVDSFLREESSVQTYDKEAIARQIREASLETQLAILTAAQDARKNAFIKFARTKDEYKPEAEKEYQEYVEKILFIFEALARIEEAEKYHRIFGQLAFACKGRIKADYQRALENIEQAITARKDKPGGEMYEFNRAVCKLMLHKEGAMPASPQMEQSVAGDLLCFADTKAGYHILRRALALEKPLPRSVRMWEEDNQVRAFLDSHPQLSQNIQAKFPAKAPEPLDEDTEASRGT